MIFGTYYIRVTDITFLNIGRNLIFPFLVTIIYSTLKSFLYYIRWLEQFCFHARFSNILDISSWIFGLQCTFWFWHYVLSSPSFSKLLCRQKHSSTSFFSFNCLYVYRFIQNGDIFLPCVWNNVHLLDYHFV